MAFSLLCFRSLRLTSVTEQTSQKRSQQRQRSQSQRLSNSHESHSKSSFTDTKIPTDDRKSSVEPCQTNGFQEVFGSPRRSKENEIYSESPTRSLHVHVGDPDNQTSNDNHPPQYHGMEHTLKPSFPESSESTDIDTRQFILASQGAVKIFGILVDLLTLTEHN